MKGAKALASEIDRRRYRTAHGVHRGVSGRFLLRTAEIADHLVDANEAAAGAARSPVFTPRGAFSLLQAT